MEISVRKEKKAKEIERKKESVSNIGDKIGKKEKKASLQLDINMELENEN